MKRNNSDFLVGGIILFSMIVLISGVLWLKQVSLSKGYVHYTLVFSNVGTLQRGDPVTVSGVRAGSVEKIYIDGAKVSVDIKLDENIVFTDSSRVVVQNIGLMGERMVGILLSEKGTPYKPNTKEHKTKIEGTFDSGIAEAMGLLGGVLNNVTDLVDTLKTVIYATVANDEFMDFFDNFVGRVDTVAFMLDKIIKDNRGNINSTVRNLRYTTDQLKGIVDENRSNINSITTDGSELISRALVIADKLDSISNSVKSITTKIDSGEGSVGMLINDEDVANSVKTSLSNLDTLVDDVDKNGLKLRLKVFGNKKYFKEHRAGK